MGDYLNRSNYALFTGKYRSYQLPTYVGRYRITDGLDVAVYKKPRWIHRVFTLIFLGWTWEDFK